MQKSKVAKEHEPGISQIRNLLQKEMRKLLKIHTWKAESEERERWKVYYLIKFMKECEVLRRRTSFMCAWFYLMKTSFVATGTASGVGKSTSSCYNYVIEFNLFR